MRPSDAPPARVLSKTPAYREVALVTAHGDVRAREYRPREPTGAGVLWVGGVGGGWDSPAQGLYGRLAPDLAAEGVASLRVRYRHPTDMDECVRDVLAGVAFLGGWGVDRVGLVGHSLGGAVVVRAASAAGDAVRAVVALATQAYGAEPARGLGPGCALLLVHGTRDRVLPPACSVHVHGLAREPKRLVLVEGAGHVLDEDADVVERETREWLVRHLALP